ncbi:hypothetical protein AB4Y44_20125 [Paraburkholderia sp. BR10937]|uniref:hypothetical protein n=1 Tax=Paraburkholderia sp. BR10937 TaxID=3236994 RepID=UPI0034D240B0
MDAAKAAGTAQSTIAYHAVRALVMLAIVAAAAGALVLALWLASFFFVASQHLNPLHAGLHAWVDAALAWYDGRLPKQERAKLAGAALFGLGLAFGAPAAGVYALLERSGRRRLHGSARFANEADIRRAGLL